jgi:hypothetical protein
MQFKPFFGTGLARSGGALYSLALSAHPEMMVACCPDLELFRSWRNAVLRNSAPNLLSAIPPNASLQDYYGTADRIGALDVILEGDLNTPFAPEEWPEFLSISIARGNLEAADLTGSFPEMRGDTYRDVFDGLLRIIGRSRNASQRRWVGFHEAWAIDAFPALARAYPEARFMIMFRDPRAIVNSMLGVEHIDPSQVAQILSYVRHWRKYAALAHRFLRSPLFAGRIHVTAHDLILTRPMETIGAICASVELDIHERMLDTNNYYDYATKKIWSGNSSFESNTAGISAHRALRWREKLDRRVLNFIEYLCGPDLRMIGYPTFTDYADVSVAADGEIVGTFLKDHSQFANWRSDLRDPLLDLGLEAARRSLLRTPVAAESGDLIRRAFLFDETYRALLGGGEPLLPALKNALK